MLLIKLKRGVLQRKMFFIVVILEIITSQAQDFFFRQFDINGNFMKSILTTQD